MAWCMEREASPTYDSSHVGWIHADESDVGPPIDSRMAKIAWSIEEKGRIVESFQRQKVDRGSAVRRFRELLLSDEFLLEKHRGLNPGLSIDELAERNFQRHLAVASADR